MLKPQRIYINYLFNYTLLQIFMLIALCYLSYGNALRGSFVFDDTVAIKQNKVINQLPTNYTAIFSSDFWGTSITNNDSHKSYRPLTTLMFHFEWMQWNMQPYHMKIINLFLHTLNSILVLLFLKRIPFSRSPYKVAFVAAILFAVHPIHTEAVSGIVSRADLMFCFIYLVSLLICCYSHSRDLLCFPLIIVCLTCLGVLFKESAIVIPLACVFLNYTFECLYLLPWKCQLNAILKKTNLFYGFTTVIILFIRLWIAGFKNPKFRKVDNPIAYADTTLTRILSQNYLFVYNFTMLLNPWYLCFDWAFGCIKLINNLKDVRVIAIIMLYSLIITTICRCRRNFSALFGLVMIIIPFLPASGIVKVGFVIAERVLYVPSMGFCYLVSYGFICLYENIKLRNFLKINYMVLVIVFILRCRQRSAEWLTEESLFTSALAVCPNNAKVHYNIARLATDMKNNTKAFYHYHKAIDLYTDYDAALMNLGNLYRENGDLEKAEYYLKKSIEVTSDFATAWMNLGIVQAARKKYKFAIKSYQNALKFRKNYSNCHYNMGNLYLEQKLYTEAFSHWQTAITLNPRFQKAWANMLTMLDSKGLFEDALRLSEQALIHLPNESSILFLRANVFGKVGRYIEAEKLFKRIIDKEPMNYMYHTNLAVLYHRWNRINEAIDSYKKALDINPQKATTARDNLSKLIKRLANEKEKT